MIVQIWPEETQRLTTRLSLRIQFQGDLLEASLSYSWVIQLLCTGLHIRFYSRTTCSKASLHKLIYLL
jgi:hypothetical protein